MKINKTGVQMKAKDRLARRKRRAVTIEFPEGLDDRLEAVAQKLQIAKSDIIRDGTEAALDALEGLPAK